MIKIRITFIPTYSWKNHFWFEDANDVGVEQDAYGLLNINLTLHFKKQRLTASLSGINIAGGKYFIGAT